MNRRYIKDPSSWSLPSSSFKTTISIHWVYISPSLSNIRTFKDHLRWRLQMLSRGARHTAQQRSTHIEERNKSTKDLIENSANTMHHLWAGKQDETKQQLTKTSTRSQNGWKKEELHLYALKREKRNPSPTNVRASNKTTLKLLGS